MADERIVDPQVVADRDLKADIEAQQLLGNETQQIESPIQQIAPPIEPIVVPTPQLASGGSPQTILPTDPQAQTLDPQAQPAIQPPAQVPPSLDDLTPTLASGGVPLRSDPRAEEGQSRFENKKKQMEDSAFFGDVSDLDVLKALDEEDEQFRAIDEKAKEEKQLELDRMASERLETIELAKARGIKLDKDEELDSLLEQKAATEKTQPATEQDVLRRTVITKVDVDREAEPMRKIAAQEQAKQNVLQEEQAKAEAKASAAKKELEEEDSRVGEIDPQRFWKNKTTGQRILAGLAIMMGAIGRALTGNQQNEALKLIIKQIDDDIDAQKLTRTEALAKKEHAFKLAELQLDKFTALSQDKKRREDISIAKQKLAAEKQKIREARIKEQKLNELIASGGLKNTNLLSLEDKNRAARLPNGNLELADNKAGSDSIRTFQGEVGPALAGAKRVLKLSKEGSRFNLFERARISSEMQALVGNLRLPFTGPGVLTEPEYKRLLTAIGNPNSFFRLPSVEQERLQTVINKLTIDRAIVYESAGITLPISKRDQLINRNVKAKIGNRDQVEKGIDKAIESGQLSKDFSK